MSVGDCEIVRDTMNFHVVLIEPDIPHNTGAVARLCVATRSRLHLVGRLGFQLDDRRVKRAGLDYWQHCEVVQHNDFESARRAVDASEWFFFSAHAKRIYTEAKFQPGCALVFGSEERGLPASLLADPERTLTIPILDHRVRSLNVAMTAGIVLYEAMRQNPVVA